MYSGSSESQDMLAMDPAQMAREIRSLRKQMRDMQLDIGFLYRKIKDADSEKTQPMVYSKRLALTSNVILGVWTFISRAAESFQERRRLTGVSRWLLVPKGLQNKNSLLAVGYDALATGLQTCLPYFMAFGFLRSPHGMF